jgi:hypothetical protein
MPPLGRPATKRHSPYERVTFGLSIANVSSICQTHRIKRGSTVVAGPRSTFFLKVGHGIYRSNGEEAGVFRFIYGHGPTGCVVFSKTIYKIQLLRLTVRSSFAHLRELFCTIGSIVHFQKVCSLNHLSFNNYFKYSIFQHFRPSQTVF